jgi:hypothetical protein
MLLDTNGEQGQARQTTLAFLWNQGIDFGIEATNGLQAKDLLLGKDDANGKRIHTWMESTGMLPQPHRRRCRHSTRWLDAHLNTIKGVGASTSESTRPRKVNPEQHAKEKWTKPETSKPKKTKAKSKTVKTYTKTVVKTVTKTETKTTTTERKRQT